MAVVTADSSAGKTIAQVHPHLANERGFAELMLQPHDPAALSGCDLAFFALPAGKSAPFAAELAGDVKIVDLGPDFQLADPQAWARHYPGPHSARWDPGLPQLPGATPALQPPDR